MGTESSDVIRFEIGPLLQCQMRIAEALITQLLLVPEVHNVKQTYMKS